MSDSNSYFNTSVKKKKSVYEKSAQIAVAVIFFILILLGIYIYISISFLAIFIILVDICLFIFAKLIFDRMNITYDYEIFSSVLTISVIYGRGRRKREVEIDLLTVYAVASYRDKFNEITQDIEISKNHFLCSDKNDKCIYFIIFKNNKNKYEAVYIEGIEKLIKAIKRAAPAKTIISSFKVEE